MKSYKGTSGKLHEKKESKSYEKREKSGKVHNKDSGKGKMKRGKC